MRNLIADCNVQLGDNPNYYPQSNYIGYTVEIPVHITSVDPNAKVINLIITTSVIETLRGDGHYVFINDEIVGRLKDEDGDEVETIEIDRSVFLRLIGPANFMLLKIRIDTWDKQGEGSDLLDDFIIKKIEIENAIPKTSIKVP